MPRFLNGPPSSSISDHVSFSSPNGLCHCFSLAVSHTGHTGSNLNSPHPLPQTGITFPHAFTHVPYTLQGASWMPAFQEVCSTDRVRWWKDTGFGITQPWFGLHPGHFLTMWFCINFLLWKIQTCSKVETTVCNMNLHKPLTWL